MVFSDCGLAFGSRTLPLSLIQESADGQDCRASKFLALRSLCTGAVTILCPCRLGFGDRSFSTSKSNAKTSITFNGECGRALLLDAQLRTLQRYSACVL
jgi:hypothetical protein